MGEDSYRYWSVVWAAAAAFGIWIAATIAAAVAIGVAVLEHRRNRGRDLDAERRRDLIRRIDDTHRGLLDGFLFATVNRHLPPGLAPLEAKPYTADPRLLGDPDLLRDLMRTAIGAAHRSATDPLRHAELEAVYEIETRVNAALSEQVARVNRGEKPREITEAEADRIATEVDAEFPAIRQ